MTADATILDTLGIEPRAYRIVSGCDTTTPCAQTKLDSYPINLNQFQTPHKIQVLITSNHMHQEQDKQEDTLEYEREQTEIIKVWGLWDEQDSRFQGSLNS